MDAISSPLPLPHHYPLPLAGLPPTPCLLSSLLPLTGEGAEEGIGQQRYHQRLAQHQGGAWGNGDMEGRSGGERREREKEWEQQVFSNNTMV